MTDSWHGNSPAQPVLQAGSVAERPGQVGRKGGKGERRGGEAEPSAVQCGAAGLCAWQRLGMYHDQQH